MDLDSWQKSRPILREKCHFRGAPPGGPLLPLRGNSPCVLGNDRFSFDSCGCLRPQARFGAQPPAGRLLARRCRRNSARLSFREGFSTDWVPGAMRRALFCVHGRGGKRHFGGMSTRCLPKQGRKPLQCKGFRFPSSFFCERCLPNVYQGHFFETISPVFHGFSLFGGTPLTL